MREPSAVAPTRLTRTSSVPPARSPWPVPGSPVSRRRCAPGAGTGWRDTFVSHRRVREVRRRPVASFVPHSSRRPWVRIGSVDARWSRASPSIPKRTKRRKGEHIRWAFPGRVPFIDPGAPAPGPRSSSRGTRSHRPRRPATAVPSGGSPPFVTPPCRSRDTPRSRAWPN
jgi:hypothetical protein